MSLIRAQPLHLVRHSGQWKASCCSIWWRNFQRHPRRESNKSTATGRWGEQKSAIQGKWAKQKQTEPDNSSAIRREELQSTAHSYDKKFQELVEEVNTKRRLGYKIVQDSDRPNKLKVLYQETVHLLEEETPKQLQRRNKLAHYPTSFVEEVLEEARKCKASLGYHWVAYISKGTQPAMNAEQNNTNQAVNDNESNNNYPTDSPVAQTGQN